MAIIKGTKSENIIEILQKISYVIMITSAVIY